MPLPFTDCIVPCQAEFNYEIMNDQSYRLRFGRRCASRKAAGDEFNAALVAYKRRELMETLASTPTEKTSDEADGPQQENQNVESPLSEELSAKVGMKAVAFRAAGALIFPGLDRGRTLWEEDNYQSSSVLKTVPVPLGGFFTNGAAGTKNIAWLRDPHKLVHACFFFQVRSKGNVAPNQAAYVANCASGCSLRRSNEEI